MTAAFAPKVTPHIRRFLALVAVILAAVAATAACGDNPQHSTETKIIDIALDGTDVTPDGDRIDVSVDQPIELHVTADAAGSMHVHSDPGQDLPYEKGTTVIKLVIDRPGIVAVESHRLNKTIVQLEVR